MSKVINTYRMAARGERIADLIGKRCEVEVGTDRVMTGVVIEIRDNLYPVIDLDDNVGVYRAGRTIKLI